MRLLSAIFGAAEGKYEVSSGGPNQLVGVLAKVSSRRTVTCRWFPAYLIADYTVSLTSPDCEIPCI